MTTIRCFITVDSGNRKVSKLEANEFIRKAINNKNVMKDSLVQSVKFL